MTEAFEVESSIDSSTLNQIRSINEFKVIDIDNDNIILEPLSASHSATLSISKENFEKTAEPYYNSFRGWYSGVYTIPIRIRRNGDVFEFENNFSLGSNIMARFGYRDKEDQFADFSFGISLTKVNLNRQNSDLGEADSIFSEVEVLSPTALTLSLGLVINFTKGVNLGLHLGWDHLSSADNKAQWIHNRKPWVGLGINVAFSKEPIRSNAGKK